MTDQNVPNVDSVPSVPNVARVEIPVDAYTAATAAFDKVCFYFDGPEDPVPPSLQAAAPLILAAELERLLDAAFPGGEDFDFYYGCEMLLDKVQRRISELRGETVE